MYFFLKNDRFDKVCRFVNDDPSLTIVNEGFFFENETIVFENETKNDRLTIVYKND